MTATPVPPGAQLRAVLGVSRARVLSLRLAYQGHDHVRVIASCAAASEVLSVLERGDADGAILDDNFFHHYLILLYRAGAQETTIATFVPQQMTLGAVTIRPTGNRTFEIETSNVKLVATTDPDGRLVRIAVPGAKVVVER